MSPLATIMTQETMNQYLVVFRLLWKLKRAEYRSNECWRCLKYISRSANNSYLGLGSKIKFLVRLGLDLRTKLANFCSNFQSYLQFEVLEGAWKCFKEEAMASTDLDALIMAHETYLKTLVSRSLLDDDCEILRETLSDYWQLTDVFANVISRLFEKGEEIINYLTQRNEDDMINEESGGWGMAMDDINDEDEDVDDVSDEFFEDMRQSIDKLDTDYESFVSSFTENLPLQAHVDLRFLVFR